jgi:hypothetical protein
MEKKDVIMLVIASRGIRYDSMINNYWSKIIKYVKKYNYSIKIFLIFGNNVKTDDLDITDDDKLILDVPDGFIPGILNKTIESFKLVNAIYNYKHILRTNLSSFFIIDNVMQISDKLENTNVYSGIIGKYGNIPFISGAGIWLSKDNIEYIINNCLLLDSNIFDDVSIAKLLINKKKSRLNRFDLTNGKEIHDKTALLNNIINDKHYHIRIKSKNIQLDLDYMTNFANIYKI